MTSRLIRAALLPSLACGLLLAVAACDNRDRTTPGGGTETTTPTTPDMRDRDNTGIRPSPGLTGEPTGPTGRSGTESNGGRTGEGLNAPDQDRDTSPGVTNDGVGATTRPSMQDDTSRGSGPQSESPGAAPTDNLGGTVDQNR